MNKDDCKVEQDVIFFASKTSKPEFGVVTELGNYWVMVQYDGDEHAIATCYEDLVPLLMN